MTETETFDEWAIVELFGHRRLAGRVGEQQIAGAQFIRVDVPAVNGSPAVTQFYSPSAVYGIHPTSEDLARRAAATLRPPAPAQRWELPALPHVDADYPEDPDDDAGWNQP